MEQRQAAESGDLLGVGLRAAVHLRAPVHSVHRPGAAKLIGKARSVAQQVLDGNGAQGRHPLEHTIALRGDVEGREIGKVFGNGIAEQEPSVFPQHHRRHRGNGLGHGIDAKDRVLRHRRAGGRISLSEALEIPYAAAPGDERDSPRHPATFDFAGNYRAQPGETGGREANIFRRGKRQRRHHGVAQETSAAGINIFRIRTPVMGM